MTNQTKEKYVRGFILVWKASINDKHPVYLTVKGGIDAIRVWKEEKIIMLPNGVYSTSQISSIEKWYVPESEYETSVFSLGTIREKLVDMRKCRTEDDVNTKLLNNVLGPKNIMVETVILQDEKISHTEEGEHDL